MKKMKIFGFLASVLALSACSLAANKVSLDEFKAFYKDNLQGTRITGYSSIKKIYTVKDSLRTIGGEEEGEYSGNKFTTSNLKETTYTVDMTNYDLVNNIDALLESTVDVSLSMTVAYKEYKYQEVKLSDDSIKKSDVAFDGNKEEYVFIYQPNKTIVENATVVLYKRTTGWDAEKGDYSKKTTTSRYTFVNNVNKYEKKEDIRAIVNELFTNEEILTVFKGIIALYNGALDAIENTLLPDDATHELEIYERNGGYAYRNGVKEDGKIVFVTEVNIVNRAAEAKEAESSASSTETSSEETSEEEITEEETSEEESSEEESSEEAPLPTGYRIKNMVQREGNNGKVIRTLAYTNI